MEVLGGLEGLLLGGCLYTPGGQRPRRICIFSSFCRFVTGYCRGLAACAADPMMFMMMTRILKMMTRMTMTDNDETDAD